jgi:hypothetical protein
MKAIITAARRSGLNRLAMQDSTYPAYQPAFGDLIEVRTSGLRAIVQHWNWRTDAVHLRFQDGSWWKIPRRFIELLEKRG